MQEIYCAICGIPRKVSEAYIAKNKNGIFYCSSRHYGLSLKGTIAHNNSRVSVNCSHCGAELKLPRHRIQKQKDFFCDAKCKGRWTSGHSVGEHGYNWRGGKITKPCSYCGSPKALDPNHANRRKGHVFCDKQCYYAWLRTQAPTTPIMRILNRRMKARLRSALNGMKRGRAWESLVGFTVTELQTHLESLFQPGMSWDNMHLWEIDHKRPRASFSFTDVHDQDFKDCWALSNLQPLWAWQNRRKSAKLDFDLSLATA